MSPLKVLITGAQGQLGGDLTAVMSRHYETKGVDIKDFDILRENALKRCVEDFKPDFVLHTAAYTDVDGCEANRELAMEVNAEATGGLARICKENGAWLIYFSTDYVFDGLKKSAYDENDIPAPLNIYGRSKLEGEKRVMEAAGDFTIVRLAWLYGYNGKNFIRAVVKQGWKQLQTRRNGQLVNPIRIVDDQRGNPTWTVDVARQVRLIIENRVRGVVHASAEGTTTWYDYAAEIFTYLQMPVYYRPCTSEQYASPAIRPANSSLENTVLKQAGLNVMRNYKTALHEFLARKDIREGYEC
ncbi:MAG: dTDP-4-dehydrorhamnose reductase [Candidatus Zixiibacteriota bacterium]